MNFLVYLGTRARKHGHAFGKSKMVPNVLKIIFNERILTFITRTSLLSSYYCIEYYNGAESINNSKTIETLIAKFLTRNF